MRSFMSNYKLMSLIDDYEKKLLLYSSFYNSKELILLNENYYEVLADIIINENNLPFEYLINRLENYFKYNIDIKENKLDFKHGEYSLLGSYVYKKLFDYNGFDKIEIIKEHYLENIETTPTKIKLLKDVRIQDEKEVAIYHYLLDFYKRNHDG